MSLNTRIKERREALNMTRIELANKIGVTSSAIANYENSISSPKIELIPRLFDALQCDANYLYQDEMNNLSELVVSAKEREIIDNYRCLDESGKFHIDTVLSWEVERIEKLASSASTVVKVPTRIISYYQHLASAGSGEYLFDDVPTDMIEIVENELSDKADFVIGVNGDSMEPTYYDGDKVFVRKTDALPVGGIGIFTRGNECFIKELGVECLISHNKKYNNIPASDEIRLVGEVLGKVE
ncbi:MAG: helix-turn-helix transcriptional regulator [Clostridiales bacterium]|nr:helix-turn-helix transcriptional regulator [Clostridiales bacterium]